MTTPTASGAHTPGEWNISAPAHGVFLNNGNYCVARLDGKDPRELWLQISHTNALIAERDALKAELANERAISTAAIADFHASQDEAGRLREEIGLIKEIAANENIHAMEACNRICDIADRALSTGADDAIACVHGVIGKCVTCDPGYSLSTVLKGRVIDSTGADEHE
jgi:hypothetical protein